MKMKVYKGKPIGVNVLSFDTYANTSLPYALECNYKFVSPLTITVEAPYPFYYAVFEDNTHWRASKISYLTNTKVVVTLENQDIWEGDSVTDTCRVSGSINTENVTSGMFFSRGTVLDDETVKNKITRRHVNITPTQVVIFQLTERLEDLLPEVYEGVVGIPSYNLTNGISNSTQFSVNDPSGTYPVTGNMGGIYTYMFKLPIVEIEGVYFNLVEMMGMLSAFAKAGVFINGRYAKLPSSFVTLIENNSQVGTITIGDNNFGNVYNIENFPSNTVLTLDTLSDVTIGGTQRWNYNNHYIYPMIYQFAYTLYGRINLGVGTLYLTIYSGDYLQASYTGNTFTTELGFNIVPAIVNPSLYSSSKEYQSLVDGLVWAQTGTMVTGAISGVGAGLGISAMTANPALGFLVGSVTALNSGIRGVQGVMNAERIQRQEAFNKTTVNKVADVTNITQYQAVFDIIYHETLNVYSNPLLVQRVMEGYTPYAGDMVSKSYRLSDSIYGYEKVYACTGNKNGVMLQTGCIIQGTRTLLQILEVL